MLGRLFAARPASSAGKCDKQNLSSTNNHPRSRPASPRTAVSPTPPSDASVLRRGPANPTSPPFGPSGLSSTHGPNSLTPAAQFEDTNTRSLLYGTPYLSTPRIDPLADIRVVVFQDSFADTSRLPLFDSHAAVTRHTASSATSPVSASFGKHSAAPQQGRSAPGPPLSISSDLVIGAHPHPAHATEPRKAPPRPAGSYVSAAGHTFVIPLYPGGIRHSVLVDYMFGTVPCSSNGEIVKLHELPASHRHGSSAGCGSGHESGRRRSFLVTHVFAVDSRPAMDAAMGEKLPYWDGADDPPSPSRISSLYSQLRAKVATEEAAASVVPNISSVASAVPTAASSDSDSDSTLWNPKSCLISEQASGPKFAVGVILSLAASDVKTVIQDNWEELETALTRLEINVKAVVSRILHDQRARIAGAAGMAGPTSPGCATRGWRAGAASPRDAARQLGVVASGSLMLDERLLQATDKFRFDVLGLSCIPRILCGQRNFGKLAEEVSVWLEKKEGGVGGGSARFLATLVSVILRNRRALVVKPAARRVAQPGKNADCVTRVVIHTGNPYVVRRLIFILSCFLPGTPGALEAAKAAENGSEVSLNDVPESHEHPAAPGARLSSSDLTVTLNSPAEPRALSASATASPGTPYSGRSPTLSHAAFSAKGWDIPRKNTTYISSSYANSLRAATPATESSSESFHSFLGPQGSSTSSAELFTGSWSKYRSAFEHFKARTGGTVSTATGSSSRRSGTDLPSPAGSVANLAAYQQYTRPEDEPFAENGGLRRTSSSAQLCRTSSSVDLSGRKASLGEFFPHELFEDFSSSRSRCPSVDATPTPTPQLSGDGGGSLSSDIFGNPLSTEFPGVTLGFIRHPQRPNDVCLEVQTEVKRPVRQVRRSVTLAPLCGYVCDFHPEMALQACPVSVTDLEDRVVAAMRFDAEYVVESGSAGAVPSLKAPRRDVAQWTHSDEELAEHGFVIVSRTVFVSLRIREIKELLLVRSAGDPKTTVLVTRKLYGSGRPLVEQIGHWKFDIDEVNTCLQEIAGSTHPAECQAVLEKLVEMTEEKV